MQEAAAAAAHGYETLYFNQPCDHADFAVEAPSFQQRYLINTSYVGAAPLAEAIGQSVSSLTLLRRSAKFESEELGWPGPTAPFFALVNSESELRVVRSYWHQQAVRQEQQLARLSASYAIAGRRTHIRARTRE